MDRKMAEAKQKLLNRRHQKEARTLGEAFEELRRICAEEDYTLEIPPRQERPNPFRQEAKPTA